jgi:drug/metabolite transporter (DMT)-like permease
VTPDGDPGQRHLLRATLFIVLSAACFSSIAIFVTLSLRAGAPLLTVLTGRFVFGTAALLPIAGWAALRGTPAQLRRALVYRAGLLQAGVVLTSGAALHWLPAATLVFMFYTYPAWVTVLMAVLGHERLTGRRAVALGLSLGGVAIMVGVPGAVALHPAGTALALAAALIFAVYLIYTNRLQVDVSPTIVSFWIAVGAGVAFLITTAVAGDLTLQIPARVWLYMAGLGFISTTLGYLLFFRGLRSLGPFRTSVVSTVEPLWAALLGWLVLTQPLTLGPLLGGMCIAAAVVLLQWPQRRTAAAAPAPS